MTSTSALIDTTVLLAAAYRRDGSHDATLPVLRGVDNGTLPEVVVLNYVLAETLNGLTTHAGHDVAVDLLDRIEENAHFDIDSLTTDALATRKVLFRQYESPSPSLKPALSRICKPGDLDTCMHSTTILTQLRTTIGSIQQRTPTIRTDAGCHHGWR
jgi:predicted nucleic acid-binding protein